MPSFYQPGTVLDHVAGADITAGDVVDLGAIGAGIADNDIATGENGGLRIAGVYTAENPDDTAFAQGATVGWDATNKKAVVGAGGDIDIGIAAYAYVAGSLSVHVLLNSRNS